MDIGVLGPFRVCGEGRPVEVHGPYPRRLLALLALTPGQEVTSDRLIDDLWGEGAPPGASATLHSHVARLRHDLPDPHLVITGRRGYQLDVMPDAVDALAFERLVKEGSDALTAERPEDAASLLTQALQLWRGTPYEEFTGCVRLEAESERLTALRLDAVERQLSADLARPGVASPVAELEALVRQHPLRESLWALLMCAQYRAGRQADALASYQRVRDILAGELGVDPGPRLQELERMILIQDPSLDRPGVTEILPTPLRSSAYPAAVDLVERDHLLADLETWYDEAVTGSGRLVYVHGEAGAGKSSLVKAWTTTAAARTTVLWGACDPLSTPRPLGPLLDAATGLNPEVATMLRAGQRDGLFDLVLDSLLALGPAVLVLEDLHWADESTLDLVRFLARRLDGTAAMVLATYRDEGSEPSDPLRVMLGDTASQAVVRRLAVPLLSEQAVATMAADSGLDPIELHRQTGGNPFFVTEVLASGGEQLPRSVQDAVLARLHRLSTRGRLAVETAAVIGSRAEPALLLDLPDVTADAVDECVTSGMLLYEPPVYVFRHELIRQAVLSGVTPGRLGALNLQVLSRLRELPMATRPLARLAEHAEMAGDPAAVLEFAVAAGDVAQSLGSHREAAVQYGRAVPYLDLLDRDGQISLLDKWSAECRVTDDYEPAIHGRERQLALLRETDDAMALVDALLALHFLYYVVGNDSVGTSLIDEGFALLEGHGPSAQLARLQHKRGEYLALDCSDYAGSVPWLRAAVETATTVQDIPALAEAQSALGMARFMLGEQGRGIDEAARALDLARSVDAPESVAGICLNLANLKCLRLDFAGAYDVVLDAERRADQQEQRGWRACLRNFQMVLAMELGLWLEAEELAHELSDDGSKGAPVRINRLLTLGLLAARRGERETAWRHLDAASEITSESVESLGNMWWVATCRAEAYLLEDNIDAIASEVLPWHEKAVEVGDWEMIADLAPWVWRAALIHTPPPGLREAEALSIRGEYRRAAEAWLAAGVPYKAAWALLDSDDEVDLREARARFDRLGATALVERTDRKLRSIGAKVPRGARPSTQANPAGLTSRELEVLALLEEGLRNAEIADRLYLSEKTVGHHVSSILAKLGASSRLEAVARARELAAVG